MTGADESCLAKLRSISMLVSRALETTAATIISSVCQCAAQSDNVKQAKHHSLVPHSTFFFLTYTSYNIFCVVAFN